MYTNGNNGNGNGNGHKRTKLSLSDLRSSGAGDVAVMSNEYPELVPQGRGAVGDESRTTSPVGAHTAEATPRRRRASKDASAPTAEKNKDVNEAPVEDDEDAELNLQEQEAKRGGWWKRAAIAFGVVVCALFIVAVAGYFFLSAGSRDEAYRVRNTTSSGRNGAEGANDNSAQALTVEEIARELNKNGNSNNAPNTNQQTVPSNRPESSAAVNGGGSPVTDRLPLGDFSTTVTSPSAPAPQTSQSAGVQNATGQSSGVETKSEVVTNSNTSAQTGSPNPERSIRVSVLTANGNNGGVSPTNANSLALTQSASPERTTETTTGVASAAAVSLPPLGTMLPVRTLGTLYTLRSEGYVRMQLTRAVSGRGWSLPRGTELYGVVRGNDFEIGRAYIQLVGFIDQSTGKLVRLQGSLLGADGADGLRGRKHSLTSGWSRALRIAGAGVAEALSTVAATAGSRPVYTSDVYGYGAPRVTSPLMQELNGMAYRQGRAGYVEVPADTFGYVLVMTSPREVQGVDANVSTSIGDLRRSSDANTQRAGTGVSESELAELITNGTAEDIRRALPRMTPEMRRVAEAALAQQ